MDTAALRKKLLLTEEEIQKVTAILVESIRTRVEKAGTRGGIVALSGGIDSSLVTLLSHEALPQRLRVLIMPEAGVTPEKDTQDAVKLAESLGIPYRVLPIRQLVDEFLRTLEWKEPPSIPLGNLKPRIRMTLLYAEANLHHLLVIGTTNKSELLMGYGTKYGDLAADIYPIGDLYKTQVWQVAESLGLPVEIVRKAPSPRLWAGQTTEQEIGYSYALLDQVLFALADLELTPPEVARYTGLPENAIWDLYRRIRTNEHKRKIPTITRITHLALDKDWRFPVERQ